MDTNVAGLNKVYCFTKNSTTYYDGKAVTITDGVNTWVETLASGQCEFMIPSMPAPAKNSYTINLHNGDETATSIYTRVIELGFGDSVRIGLYLEDEIVKRGFVASANTPGLVAVPSSVDTGLKLVTMGGSVKQYIYTEKASATQTGCVKVGNGLQMGGSFSDTLAIRKFERSSANCLEYASSTSIGSMSSAFGIYAIPSSVQSRLQRGFVEGIEVQGSYTLIPILRDAGFFNQDRIAVKLYNISSAAQNTPSSIYIYYAYIPD